jgi:N-acetylmuramoyl-L-alanine amidase
MRLTTAGTALLLAAAVPAVVVLGTGAASSAAPAPVAASYAAAVPAAVVAASTPSVLRAAGPVPSSWEGGHAVAVAPRWWPRGKAYASAPWPALWPKPVAFSPTRRGVLSGLVIALDPGHDIGNRNHVALINKKYWVGLTKTCNTTGTATNAGYPEATYNWDVVARLRRLLVANGATVVVTRDRNTASTYGPCVGARGSFPSQEKARFMVQVHADGAPASGHGFHVIAPAYYKGYTDDIYVGSGRLAAAMVAGMVSKGLQRSTYLSKTIQVRKDTGAINMSDVPTVTVETLNMRNAADARLAMSSAGRQKVAAALYAGILRYAASL